MNTNGIPFHVHGYRFVAVREGTTIAIRRHDISPTSDLPPLAVTVSHLVPVTPAHVVLRFTGASSQYHGVHVVHHGPDRRFASLPEAFGAAKTHLAEQIQTACLDNAHQVAAAIDDFFLQQTASQVRHGLMSVRKAASILGKTIDETQKALASCGIQSDL